MRWAVDMYLHRFINPNERLECYNRDNNNNSNNSIDINNGNNEHDDDDNETEA